MNRKFFQSLLLLLVLTVSGFVSPQAHAQAPANDNFANARILPGTSGTIPGTNVDATKESGEPNHAGNVGGASVWFRWTAPHSSNVTIDAVGNGTFPTLAVYTGNAVNSLTEIASNFDQSSSGAFSSVTFQTVAGTVYQIAVDGPSANNMVQTGSFTLSYLLRPANDNFANARVLPGTSGIVPGTNIVASKEIGEPNHAQNVGGASVWYRWTATYSSTVTINTLGNGFPTLLAVYTGNAVNALTEIASNFNPSSIGAPSSVTFAAVAGTIYQIAVDGQNPDMGAQTGTFVLDYLQFAPEIAIEESGGNNIPDNGSTSFGNVEVGNNASLSFTIRNTGSADLTGFGIIIDGPAASEFILIGNPSPTVGPDGATNFSVQFVPGTVGAKTATIHINSNDADESPFDIVVNGTGVAPEIAVQQTPGANIPNNGSSNFGKVIVGSSAPLKFTIRNNGSSDLALPIIRIDGPAAADFILTGNPSPIVGPGGNTIFTVQFSPTTAGSKTAAIFIGSNDSDESPFNILLNGTGVAPEIAVQQPRGANIPNNGSRNIGKVPLGSNKPLTFIIRNNGSSDLAVPIIRIEGPAAPEFILTRLPSNTVSPGKSTRFTVRFTPDKLGIRNAAIFIGSNDTDESPFNIILKGNGVAPEIAVQQTPGGNVPNNSSSDFGKVSVGSSAPLNFIIRNNGSSELALPFIRIEGPAAPEFTLTRLPSDTVDPGGSTRFTVRFTPATAGTKTAAILIGSNDSDESPFNIVLNGAGDGSAITVTESVEGNVANGDQRDFGTMTVGQTGSVRTFTIRNDGTQKLSGLSMTTVGNKASYIVTPISETTLAPGDSTTFTTTFTPDRTGRRKLVIRIASNKVGEDPFEINLIGTGTSPEIAIELEGGENIPDQGMLDFGSAIVCKDRPVRKLTIRNLGTENLTSLAVSTSSSTGFFFSSVLRVSSLAPGASTTFKVTFCPGYYGNWRGLLSISSNDTDESPLEIILSGSGVARLEKASGAGLLALADSLKSSPPAAKQDRELSRVRIMVNPDDGQKYLTLEITKVPGTENTPRSVEVSPNLMDWYSGRKHTTVIRDDAKVLKVRDNTPFTPGRKRFIRLRDS